MEVKIYIFLGILISAIALALFAYHVKTSRKYPELYRHEGIILMVLIAIGFEALVYFMPLSGNETETSKTVGMIIVGIIGGAGLIATINQKVWATKSDLALIPEGRKPLITKGLPSLGIIAGNDPLNVRKHLSKLKK